MSVFVHIKEILGLGLKKEPSFTRQVLKVRNPQGVKLTILKGDLSWQW